MVPARGRIAGAGPGRTILGRFQSDPCPGYRPDSGGPKCDLGAHRGTSSVRRQRRPALFDSSQAAILLWMQYGSTLRYIDLSEDRGQTDT